MPDKGSAERVTGTFNEPGFSTKAVDMSMRLDALRGESEHRASVEVSISDQMVIAADLRPKKFRTRWQRIVYDGPTARKDAESAERVAGSSFSRTCSGPLTRRWES